MHHLQNLQNLQNLHTHTRYDDGADTPEEMIAAARAKGLVRTEGKEYVMKDGDVVEFLFNV